MGTLQKLPHLVHPQTDKGLFTEQVLRELADIREEVEEACSLDSGTAPVPDSAYEETLTFLQQMSRDIPIPDIIWLEDGGIGLEWRPGDGIATMSLYGDGLIIYGATWKGSRKISGTCPLSDLVLLPHFLNVLREFFFGRRRVKRKVKTLKSKSRCRLNMSYRSTKQTRNTRRKRLLCLSSFDKVELVQAEPPRFLTSPDGNFRI